MTTPWYDLNKDGKRLESIIKQMHTKMKQCDTDDPEQLSMYFAYADRLIRATGQKHSIAETVLNVKSFLAIAKKKHGALPTEGVIIPSA